MTTPASENKTHSKANTSLLKAIHILKGLAEGGQDGVRLVDLAQSLELSQPSAHRLLKTLIAANLVEQLPDRKAYALSLEFFVMATHARQRSGMLGLARPSLLRLSATLNDTIFLLVRSNFDAVCLDRVEGPYPIRSFTGDIGGKVPLGIGQGSLAILAFLPEEEREAIIRFNMPRILDKASVDEVDLRIMIAEVREAGAATFNFNMIDGMAGVGVPVLDRGGNAVAALSVGTLASRLTDKRLQTVVEMLRREATLIGQKLNPLDPTLRHPTQAFSGLR